MDDHTGLILAALICITVLEVVALLMGIDGVMLSSVLMLIAGLVGYKGSLIMSARKGKK